MSDNTDRVARVASVFARHRRARGTPCSASADVLQIASVGVALMSARHNGPVCNSDERSFALDELQFSLGEGPSLDAFAQHEAIVAPELGNGQLGRWPAFTASALEHGTHGIFALPLNAGTKCIGVLTLYRDVAGALSPEQQADSLVVADAVAASIMESQSSNETDVLAVELGDPASHRAEVHQASGMVAVQLGVPVTDAEVRLRAHAYAADRSVVDIARDIVERRLRLIGDGPIPTSGSGGYDTG
ncbi:MAG TPA: GAF and ANTAR domain-containing protein [Acidimicrobiia bacterium]|nr:GAF and ANTAR domain-containing protein [Acidimicrobiia bacterium]